MELIYLFVHLLLSLNVYASLINGEAIEVTEAITDEQQKIRQVQQECRNIDYKKYIKCLMRPKRHHHFHGDGLPENETGHCLETCLKKCDLEHDCDKKCNYCTKRTKHKHQIITEYETSCESGNCNGNGNGNDGLRATNITTNIDINNIINGVRHPPSYFPNGTLINDTNVSVDTSHVFTPSMPLIPQISMVPQITYGIGLGVAGGCAYGQWLCIPQIGTRGMQFPNVYPPDCSLCGNPLLHYKCDVTFCYSTQYTANSIGTSCKSPACIGGSK